MEWARESERQRVMAALGSWRMWGGGRRGASFRLITVDAS